MLVSYDWIGSCSWVCRNPTGIHRIPMAQRSVFKIIATVCRCILCLVFTLTVVQYFSIVYCVQVGKIAVDEK